MRRISPKTEKPMKQKLNGWLVFDKPSGISSNQFLRKVKRLLRPEKVGFAGTLDPLASGVLPVAFGEATKVIPYMMGGKKSYEFSIRWGEETDTLDAEGKLIKTSHKFPSEDEIKGVLKEFLGSQKQVPPKYSAVKINGQRAYKRARAEEEFEIKAKQIELYEFSYLGTEALGEASFFVRCSKGTYIRSLARDLAYRLGTVATVSKLRRMQVGAFGLDLSISLDFLEKMGDNASRKLLPCQTPLDDISAYALSEEDAERLKRGQWLYPSTQCDDLQRSDVFYKAIFAEKLIAMIEWDRLAKAFKPKRVFNL